MDSHYGVWCPVCDKPAPEIKIEYDFFRTAKYIAAHEGYDYTNASQNNWYRAILRQMDFRGNDTIYQHYVPVDTERDDHYSDFQEYATVMRQFDEGLVKHFGVKPGTDINLWISW